MADLAWWEQRSSFVHELDNSLERGTRELRAHQLENGDWEYGIVWWFHGGCTLLRRFVNGEEVEDDEEGEEEA